MKSKMLGRNGYDRLLRCSTPSECMSVLREEGYFETAVTLGESLDPATWQDFFDTKMITIIHKLARLSPDHCANVLAAFEDLYRLEFLKSGLRLVVAHEEVEAPFGIVPSELTADLLRSIVETRNVERLVQAVGAPALYGEISSAIAENRPLPLVEAIVDRYGFGRIWSATDMLDWADKRTVQPLIGEHIDAVNLLLVARSKSLGITREEIQQFLLSVNYRLGDALSVAANSGSTTNALRAVTKTIYGPCVERFLETFKENDPLHPLDVALRRRHASRCLSAFSGFPFCAGLPLAFAYLMRYELSDVGSLISGKHDGVSADRIEQLLTL